MRVLHITRDFPPESRGGISSAVGGMVKALSGHGGVQCRVISFDGWRPRGRSAETVTQAIESREAEVPVLRVLSDAGIREALTMARAWSPHILHLHHGMLWDFTSRIRASRHIPAVKSIHVLQAESSRLLGLRDETLSLKGQNAAVAEADILTVPARAAADILVRDHPSVRSRLRIIPLGIHDSERIRDAVATHPYGPPGPVLYVGRFSEVKGTPDLFRSIPQVLARHAEVPFVIAGGIPDSPKMERRWKRKLMALLPEDFRKNVQFTGWISEETLASLYRTARLLVSPSRLETYGLAVLEAMLFGLPVAGTVTPGTSDLVRHGASGLLSRPGDAPGLAEHISKLLDNVELSQQMGKNGADAVRRERLWNRIIPELVTVYQELLTGST